MIGTSYGWAGWGPSRPGAAGSEVVSRRCTRLSSCVGRAYNAAPFAGIHRGREDGTTHGTDDQGGRQGHQGKGRPAVAKTAKKAAKAPVKKAAAKATPAKAAKKTAAAKKAAPKKAPRQEGPGEEGGRKPPRRQRRAAARVIPALAKRDPARQQPKAPPKRKGPLDKFLLGQLEAARRGAVTYLRQAASLKAEADLLVAEREPGDVQFDEESGEGDTLAVERERDLALSAQARRPSRRSTGRSTRSTTAPTGSASSATTNIPKERLQALPYAALCVQCKSAGFTRR